MSIYSRPARQQFQLTVGGADLASQFAGPWTAFSVVVNNRTNQHLFLPDAGEYVPPGAFFALVVLPGVSQAQAKFQAPPGVTDLPAIAGQVAKLTYFEEELAPSPGVIGPMGIRTVTQPAGAAVYPIKISLVIAGGATGALLAMITNARYLLFKGWLVVDVVEAGTIASLAIDRGVTVDFALFTNNYLGPQPFDFEGTALNPGEGLRIHNYGAAQHIYSGCINVAQLGP